MAKLVCVQWCAAILCTHEEVRLTEWLSSHPRRDHNEPSQNVAELHSKQRRSSGWDPPCSNDEHEASLLSFAVVSFSLLRAFHSLLVVSFSRRLLLLLLLPFL